MLKVHRKLLKRFALGFLIIAIVTFLASVIFKPSIQDFLNLVEQKDLGTTASPAQKFLRYLINNGLKVPVQMFVLALIPLPFLYLLNLIFMAGLTGFVFYLPMMPLLHGQISFENVLVGVLPQMILEVFGFLIFACLLYDLNQSIRSRIFNKARSDQSISQSLSALVRGYLVNVLPLILLAAFIEAFFIPWIATKF